MKFAVKTFLPYVVVALAAMVSGCGYRAGSIMHPQVKSIAIAPIKNETLEPHVSALVRGALAELFMTDGSLRVQSMETADSIVYGRITRVENTGTARDSYWLENEEMIYRAAEWTIRVTFEFVVVVPGNPTPLISKREVVGSGVYDVTADPTIARRNGLREACRQVAEQTVFRTTEAW